MAVGGSPSTEVLGTLDGNVPDSAVRSAVERFERG
jgi:hypothetical protein